MPANVTHMLDHLKLHSAQSSYGFAHRRFEIMPTRGRLPLVARTEYLNAYQGSDSIVEILALPL